MSSLGCMRQVLQTCGHSGETRRNTFAARHAAEKCCSVSNLYAFQHLSDKICLFIISRSHEKATFRALLMLKSLSGAPVLPAVIPYKVKHIL